ncbi:MAG: ABC transporter substrate-binding protein [Lachnospiraceae bacterium]
MIKKGYRIILLGICILAVVVMTGVLQKKTKEAPKEEDPLITIGFSQVGAESDWRTANSISMKETFTQKKGYDLIFEDARQQQENQIMAIRGFIQQDVDFIIFSPVVESGWDTVLEEAKRAEIPVIIIDRMVDVKDDELYTAWVGSDFYLQGKKACAVLKRYIEANAMEDVKIVNIQGTLGATSQIGRTKALEDAAQEYGWQILDQQPGDYNSAKAQEVMTTMLNQYDDIDFVYCDNDNEAFGAIKAIKEAGKTVGPDGDIQIISFDATRAGLRYTLDGQIMVNVECNPLQGPEVEKMIYQLKEGMIPEKQKYVSERIFVYGNELSQIEIGEQLYEVDEVTEELISSRVY